MNDFNRGALQVPCLRLDYGFGEQWASVELGDGTGYIRLGDYEKAVAENAKLRELLEAVLQCAGETKRDKGCDACPMYNGPWRNDGTWCLLRPTLRELGIEVGK